MPRPGRGLCLVAWSQRECITHRTTHHPPPPHAHTHPPTHHTHTHTPHTPHPAPLTSTTSQLAGQPQASRTSASTPPSRQARTLAPSPACPTTWSRDRTSSTRARLHRQGPGESFADRGKRLELDAECQLLPPPSTLLLHSTLRSRSPGDPPPPPRASHLCSQAPSRACTSRTSQCTGRRPSRAVSAKSATSTSAGVSWAAATAARETAVACFQHLGRYSVCAHASDLQPHAWVSLRSSSALPPAHNTHLRPCRAAGARIARGRRRRKARGRTSQQQLQPCWAATRMWGRR